MTYIDIEQDFVMVVLSIIFIGLITGFIILLSSDYK